MTPNTTPPVPPPVRERVTLGDLIQAVTPAIEAEGVQLRKYAINQTDDYNGEHLYVDQYGRAGRLACEDGDPIAEGDIFAKVKVAQALDALDQTRVETAEEIAAALAAEFKQAQAIAAEQKKPNGGK